MANTIDIFEPRTMLKFVERMAKPSTFLRDTFFKGREYSVTDKVDIDMKKGSRKIAPFVSEKLGGKLVENSGFKTETFAPPLVAPFKITTAADIMNRSMGENIYSAKAPDERAAEKLVKDLAELEEMVTRREELMCAQALFEGKITVVGDGLDHEIDFNFTNKETLSGTDLWSDPASDPIADLKRYQRVVQQRGHVTADTVIMAADVVDTFINHKKVQDILNLRHLKVGELEVLDLPNGVTYIGHIPGVGKIYEYNEYYLADDQTMKPMVPDGTVTLLSTAAEFSMAYAAITLVKDGQFTTFESERVPDTWTEKNPARQIAQLNSKPLPIPKEVDSWFVAKVK
ncbi:phage capsid protein [Sporosarcina sp. P37]|uniref:major capsid protein n=1 Tax=unclassified Sporosarcina TaxID=2647733 RepID=UPI000A17D0AB|nr:MULTISPECIES: major capsid protein [unclassified Sporosarcina]ARK25997.1 phage capsid protein [Sporosarcina sp. P37]PID19366.1 major capsid protein [Sporosarcina sp. P35]